MSRTLNQYAAAIHANAVAKGFYDREDRTLPEVITLAHAELSEVYEEWRNENEMSYSDDGKPEGILPELVDVIIVCLDMLASYGPGIEIDQMMEKKMAYNQNRPNRHGRRI